MKTVLRTDEMAVAASSSAHAAHPAAWRSFATPVTTKACFVTKHLGLAIVANPYHRPSEVST